MPTLAGVPFRVLIAGSRRFHDYRALRAVLDALLAKRLPHVELLTVGGPGVAMLAASYAKERGLTVMPMEPEFGRWPDAVAVEKRDSELVALVDAAVLVCADREPGALRLLKLMKLKGVPVHVVGGERPAKVNATAPPPEPETRRGLPD